jgi:hypothetical protein
LTWHPRHSCPPLRCSRQLSMWPALLTKESTG